MSDTCVYFGVYFFTKIYTLVILFLSEMQRLL
jgi:hypothetical protein